jgi:hypothetical protein
MKREATSLKWVFDLASLQVWTSKQITAMPSSHSCARVYLCPKFLGAEA